MPSAVLAIVVAGAIPAALAYLALREEPESAVSGPIEPAFLLDLGDLHLKHGHLEGARLAYARVRESASEPALRGRAEYGLALVDLARKDLAAAVPHLEKAIELVPDEGRANLRVDLAEVLFALGRVAESEAVVDLVLSSPARPEVHRRLAALYRDRARGLASRVEARLAAAPDDRGQLAFLGDIYAEMLGEAPKAISVYERLLALEPGNLVLLDRLVALSLQLQDFARARTHGEVLAARLERDPRARLGVLRLLAELALAAKDPDRAIALLTESESIAASEEKDDLRVRALEIRKASGTLAEEIARLETEGELDCLWLVYTRVEPDKAKALEVARKILEKDPDGPRALAAVVSAASAAGEDEEVARAGARLLEIAPEASKAAILPYAAAMRKLARLEEAARALRAAAEKVPGLAPACHIAIAGLAGPEERAASLARAVEAARASGDAGICLETAAVLRAAGAADQALAVVEAGFGLGPTGETSSGLAWERILALEALGRAAEAEAACRALARDLETGSEARRAAERKVLELMQKQGKPIKIETDG